VSPSLIWNASLPFANRQLKNDNIVFVDAFRQSGVDIEGASLAVRMQWSFNRAVSAMLVTSATTFAAFVITAISPFVGLSTFGAYAALLVAVNYALVVTYLPAVIVLWHKKWGSDPCLPCMDEPDLKQPSFFERLFINRMSPFVVKWKTMLFLVFLIIFLGSAALTTQTVPRSEVFQLLPDGYNFQDASTRLSEFEIADGTVDHKIRMVFGLEGMDTSEEAGADRLDADKPGKVIYVDSFDLESPSAQARISEACREPARYTAAGEDLADDIKIDLTKTVKCFIDSFYTWVDAKYPNRTIAPNSLVGGEFTTEMKHFLGSLEGNAFSTELGQIDNKWKWCSLEFVVDLPIGTTFATGGPTRVAWYVFVIFVDKSSLPCCADNFLSFAFTGRK
jgi:Patched family